MDQMRWFQRYPRSTLLTFGLAVGLLLDLGAGALLIPRENVAFRTRHDVYHHDLAPNQIAPAKWGSRRYWMVTNSLGFRDGEVRDVELESDRHRILMIGDSFVEGIGVDWRNTFVGMMEAALDSSKIELLNAGVIGYSPKLYAKKTAYLLEEVGLHVDEVYVFIDISDIQNELVYESWEGRRAGPADWLGTARRLLKRHSFAASTISSRLSDEQRVQWNAFGMPFAEDLDAPEYTPEQWRAKKWVARGVALAASNMDKLLEVCKRAGVAVTIVVYPWPTNVTGQDRDHAQDAPWERYSRERGVDFIELYSDFRDAAALPGASPDSFFIRGDMHWNARGHRVVADRLLRNLRDPSR